MKLEKYVESKGITYRVVISYYDSSFSTIEYGALYDGFGNRLLRASSFHALGTQWQHLFNDPTTLAKGLVESHQQNMQKQHQESEQIKSFHEWDGQL